MLEFDSRLVHCDGEILSLHREGIALGTEKPESNARERANDATQDKPWEKSPKPFHTWKRFKEHCDDITKKARKSEESKRFNWIFRGQPDATQPLKTSLERRWERYPHPPQDRAEAERLLCREFERRLHQYPVDIPANRSPLECLSLMQHYGAPTRLLDFTYSFYIAAYFALEGVTNKCAVWAINDKWAREQSKLKFPKDEAVRAFLDERTSKDHEEDFKRAFCGEPPTKFAAPINPFHLTQRLTIQRGVFMCPGDIGVPFKDNLSGPDDWNNEDHVQKLVLEFGPGEKGEKEDEETPEEKERKKKEWRTALEELYDLNISRATLFPGLVGFAESLKYQPPRLQVPG